MLHFGNWRNNSSEYDLSDEMYQAGLSAFFTRVYGWLFAGLALTMLTSAFVSGSVVGYAIASSLPLMLVLCLGEVALVIALKSRIGKLSKSAAIGIFGAYSVLNGLTLSVIFRFYAKADITKAFGFAAVFFGIMCVYGFLTKADLSKTVKILWAGAATIIIFMLVNLFLHNGALDFVICLAGVAIFTGLTAVDTQRIKASLYPQALSAPEGDAERVASNLAIIGALFLYLDFINVFLYLLRLFGRGGGR
ncbi:MAG: Bax inhibitor-1/YccA family protein [Clostridiales bacterium]|nr:Bax inhibitor-1/YccA family protein [Clostridiales bacterium]